MGSDYELIHISSPVSAMSLPSVAVTHRSLFLLSPTRTTAGNHTSIILFLNALRFIVGGICGSPCVVGVSSY